MTVVTQVYDIQDEQIRICHLSAMLWERSSGQMKWILIFPQLNIYLLDIQQTLCAVLNQWWDRQWRSSRDSTSLCPGNFSSKIWLPSYHWRRVLGHVVTHLTQTRDKFLRLLIMCKPGGRGHLQLVHQCARWCTKTNEAEEKQRKVQKEPDFNCLGIGRLDHRQWQNRPVKDKIE